jgi:hypothetical protein
MKLSRQLEVKMNEERLLISEMNFRKVIVKRDRLFVFIRHDSAENWGFRY